MPVYVEVHVPGNADPAVEVLIEGAVRGVVDTSIRLPDPAIYLVSVDLPGAEEKDTHIDGTFSNPTQVEISVS